MQKTARNFLHNAKQSP